MLNNFLFTFQFSNHKILNFLFYHFESARSLIHTTNDNKKKKFNKKNNKNNKKIDLFTQINDYQIITKNNTSIITSNDK